MSPQKQTHILEGAGVSGPEFLPYTNTGGSESTDEPTNEEIDAAEQNENDRDVVEHRQEFIDGLRGTMANIGRVGMVSGGAYLATINTLEFLSHPGSTPKDQVMRALGIGAGALIWWGGNRGLRKPPYVPRRAIEE